MAKIDLLTESEEGSYREFLANCKHSSVQYSLDWRNTIRDLGKDEPFFVVAKEHDEIVGVLPLYYYRSKMGNLLTTVAWHTISGIILSTAVLDQERGRTLYKGLLDYSVELAKELDCKALSIGTNPFLDDKGYYLEYLQPDYQMENFIQYINLNEIFDKQGNVVHPNYAQRSNLSRNLKSAELQKAVISDDPSKSNLEQFFKLYSERMKEFHAMPIPKQMFNSIHKNLVCKGKGKFLFTLFQEKIVSSALFLFNERIMDDYTMCMDPKYRNLRSNYLIVYRMLKWATERGVSIFNWQSSPMREDGVYRWKEQWGSRETTSLYLSKIFNHLSQWNNVDLKELREAYSFHYLLPFNLLKNEKGFTTKDQVSRYVINSGI
jgi:hypothetical protein